MKRYNPEIHHRRSIRLKNYDYSQEGLYFITACMEHRKHLLGRIENGEMILNDAGKMICTEWEKLVDRFPFIALHEFVVMPNHFHGILEIVAVGNVETGRDVETIRDIETIRDVETTVGSALVADLYRAALDRAATRAAPTKAAPTIGDIIGAFKSITTVSYIRGVKELGWPSFKGKLWQRNYYEHIIRNEQAYQTISNYIINNPKKWEEDKFNSTDKESI